MKEQDEREKQPTTERSMGPQDQISNQFSLISLLSLFFPPISQLPSKSPMVVTNF